MSLQVEKIINTDKYTVHNGVYFVGMPVENFQDIPRGHVDTASDNSTWSRWRLANYSFFKEILHQSNKKTLLDLGAGPQQFRELTHKFDVCAVDTYPDKGVHVVVDLNNNFPFFDETFDIVFLSNVLEHIYDYESFLNESYRVLKPGGFIVGTVPFLMQSHQRPHDYFRYTDLALKRVLEDIHFIKMDIRPLGSPLNVLKSMQHKFFGLTNQNFKNRIFKNVFRKILSVLFWSYEVVFGDIEPSFTYTEGYGFYAEK